ENLINAIENNIVFLLICGGYQLFGQYYKDSEGNTIEGIGAFNYYTETKEERTTGYIVTETILNGKKIKITGFENHAGHTFGVLNEFGKVLKGVGNNFQDKTEGISYKNVIGTYIHGPLLARNLELTDEIIRRMALNRGYEVNFTDSINRFEYKAKRQILSEFGMEIEDI
ncbi:MAG: hypothetical protein Q4P31_07375, partial [Andreesenia angusta]|nr:hypothetical protein [Andreesenia angusta]